MHLSIDSWEYEVWGALATQRPARVNIQDDTYRDIQAVCAKIQRHFKWAPCNCNNPSALLSILSKDQGRAIRRGTCDSCFNALQTQLQTLIYRSLNKSSDLPCPLPIGFLHARVSGRRKRTKGQSFAFDPVLIWHLYVQVGEFRVQG
jgi:hypothetical protein